MSLTWDLRTVLASEMPSVPVDAEKGKATSGAKRSGKLEPIDIWTYLISLSWNRSGSNSESEVDYRKLRYYKATDFDGGWNGVGKYIGDGASYRVEKCTLDETRDGKPVVVAVKKIKAFQNDDRQDEANSSAHQRSVVTVLKELRILTHVPLWYHMNIVSLLGYRPDFASKSSIHSTDVSLVVEFAPFGTLKDLCQSLAPNEKLDLITKAHLMHDIASGLEALHKCAIAHGDVKMENTLVFEGYGRPYVAKLSDFGHSLIDLHTPERRSQVYLGTLLFNAPEIRCRDAFVPMEADALFKCDIYSFGLLCWDLILGGVRYYKSVGEIIGSEDATATVSRLNTLPKDELLFRSLISLKEAHGNEGDSLVQIITRVLLACLKDNPRDRENIENIVSYFRQNKALAENPWRRQVNLSPAQDKQWPTPLEPFGEDDASSVATFAIPQMPLAVQVDLLDQLRYAIKTSTSNAGKRSALYDLAMCYLSNVGTEKVDTAKSLGMLAEAARMGSCKALAIVFRLYERVMGEVPAELWETDHSVARLEKSLSPLDSGAYFAERLRLYEKMHQADALRGTFDLQQNGETVLAGVHLAEAHAKLEEMASLSAQHLECVPCVQDGDEAQIQGNLLVTAARLGLLPLVELLFAHMTATDEAWGESVLVAACRGGHVDVLRWLLSRPVSMLPGDRQRATPLHWLSQFAPAEAGVALGLLVGAAGGKESLRQRTPDPGMVMGNCVVAGTPLEVAIAANNTRLVHAFLQTGLGVDAIGWTASTYPLAVALNLHHLLPSLLDWERTYRDALWTKPRVPPLGLFDLVHPHDALLPLLIHGAAAPHALQSTLDFVLGTGAAAIHDEDANGSTALSHAVARAPCWIDLELVAALAARGARFGRSEEPMAITNTVVKRRDAAAAPIVQRLLEDGLLPLDVNVLAASLQAGSHAVASAVLDARVDGRGLAVDAPLLAGDARIPLLFVAVGLGDAAAVRLLLDRGAPLETRFNDKTPLEAAVVSTTCDAATIDLLLERGAAVDLGSHSILHSAAMRQATVRGIHVLFHLLEHDRLRALVNTPTEEVLPLAMAVYAGNAPAVLALLQAGARVEPGDMLDRLLRVAVDAGRRPQQCSYTWSDRSLDKEELYQWRLSLEDIILTLLDKGDPGHGRTRLHVAVQLGNRQRVVELVEQQGQRMFVGDREKRTPGALLEHVEELKQAGEDDEYLQELKQLHEYVKLQIIKDVAVQGNTPDALEKWLGDHPVAPEDSDENKQATAELQVTLEKLKLEREETELSVGDGIDSVAEREVKLRSTLELQRKRHGETHPNTLRTLAVLYNVLFYQSKIDEVVELHKTVFAQRQAELPPDHVDLFESMIDKIYISISLGQIQEANDYALAVSLNAFDTFGNYHPVTVKAEAALASTETQLGKYDEAIKIQEAVLEIYDRIHRDQILPDSSKVDETLDFSGPLFYLKGGLVLDYCRAQKFEAAAKLARSLPHRLRTVKSKGFFEAFHALISVAAGLDLFQQHEISEPILTNVVEICLEVHQNRKSYATHTVLEQLATHYKLRGLWEKEAQSLQKLLDHLQSTTSPEHPSAIKQKRNLATALGKCGSWAQASLLLEQVLNVLKHSSPHDDLELADIKTALCEALRRQDLIERSEAYGREAVLAYQASLGDDHQVTHNAELQLGLTLSVAAKSTEAIDLFQHRVASTVRSHGETHILTGKAVEDLCTALLRARLLDEAEVQADRHLHIVSHVPETNDRMVSLALYMQATCKELRGELDEARRLYAASLELERVNAGSVATSDMLTSMCTLARLHIDVADFAAAEPLVREVLAAAAADSEPARLAASFLGYVCEQTDRNSEAVAQYRAALESTRRVLGDTADTTLDMLADLLRVILAEGDTTEALKLGGELVKRRRELRGEYHEDTIDTKKDLVFILPALGFWPEAELVQQDVLRFMEAKHPEEREEACILLEVLIESCSKQGRWSEAEAFGRRAMDFRLASFGIREEATLQVMAALARVLVEADRLDEAEAMIDLVEETCQHVFKDGDDERDIPYPTRAYLLFKQGRLDEAIALQHKVVASDRNNLDAVLFLVQLYETLGNYQEARKFLRKASSIAFSESREASGELEKVGLVRTFIQDVRLKTATRDFEHTAGQGRMAWARTEKWCETNYAHSELHLACLQAMEALYEALGDEEEKLQTILKIKEQVHRREEQKKQHLKSLQSEADRFEKFNAGGLAP